jgi:hypothetical protein
MRTVWNGICLTTIVAGSLGLSGCDGVGSGMEIRLAAGQEQQIVSADVARGAVSLPADRAFNIHLGESQQNPGSEGTATSRSRADRAGEAYCTATSTNGGSASSSFHLGHRVINRTDSPQDVELELSYALEQTVKATPDATARTIGTLNLDLVVQDSGKRQLANVPVIQATSDQAISSAESRDHRTLSIQMEPGRWYDIMLVARAEAQADDGQEATAKLKLSDVQLVLSFSSAVTRPATTSTEK